MLAALVTSFAIADDPPPRPDRSGEEVARSAEPISVRGTSVHRWQTDTGEASLFSGECVYSHGDETIPARRILCVVDGEIGRVRNRIVIDSGDGRPRRIIKHTIGDPKLWAPDYRGEPRTTPDLMRFLIGDGTAGDGLVRPVQFSTPVTPPSGGDPPALIEPPAIGPPPLTLEDGATTGGFRFLTGGGTRSIEILARDSTTPPNIKSFNRPAVGETVIAARGGVTVLIRDVTAQLPGGETMELGTISLSADRIVAWLPLLNNLFSGVQNLSSADGELYLEGNIVFRQGERIIYAQSMYFNAAQDRGVVLDAEAITTVPTYQGVVRLKAEVLQQVARGNFLAFDAAVTTSRIGVPRYWLQSERLALNDRQKLAVDPLTGGTIVTSQAFVESQNNFVYLAGIPVFYWPTLASPLEVPTLYVDGIGVRNDDIFGTQLLVDWNMFQLLGIDDAPRGVDWTLSTDYLSERGPALGTAVDYTLPGLFGLPGPVDGFFDTWVIDDDGLDRLGQGRLGLEPEADVRGRSLLRHRHYLPNDYEFIAEFGWLSDRFFLEQYFENEWDRDVEHRSAVRLRKYFANNQFDLFAQPQVNDFFTETERLPQLEHHLLGGSLLGDRFTYSTRNTVGYQRLNPADPPDDPTVAFTLQPGVADVEGVVAQTRQEIALPVSLGPLKIVPNASGEATHYGEALDGDDLTRLVGAAGIRLSLPMVSVNPTVQSRLLNIRGLAHKVEWKAEYFYADSDTDLFDVPYYDSLDDTAQEEFRRRFTFDTFGGVLPPQFDPRTYALRQGYQRNIASPSGTIADDLQQIRLGVNQRWQTKRGLPGVERIADVFELNAATVLFPEADRDNFGETVGPTTYDAAYHIGPRLSLVSDGYIDFFDGGLRSISAGVTNSRPGVGDTYIGLMSLEGPISSTVLRTNFNYRLNEKWIASAGNVYDFGEIGNVGQNFGLVRIGESFLWRVGVNVDAGRDNVSFTFGFEPRFLPRPKLGFLGGQLIPPPGVLGLE